MVMLATGIFMNEMSDEWDLTDAQTGFIGTSSVLGILLGTCVFGYLSDRLGRSFMFKRTLVIAAAGIFVLAFSGDYAMGVIFMFLTGFGVGGDEVVAGTAFTEFCPTSKRWAIALLAMAWSFGSWICVGLAWLLASEEIEFVHMWRLYAAILAGILILFWLVRLPMDETPKFLALKGRFEEAKAVIEKISARNGHRDTAPVWDDSLLVPQAETPKSLSRSEQIKCLFRPPYLRTTLLLSPVKPTQVWFLLSSAYVINEMFMPELLESASGGSESREETYMTMFFQQVAGVFGILLATWTVETRMGRKWTQSAGLFLSGVCVFLFLIATEYWMVLGASALVFSFSLMANSAQYPITLESYPTEIRSTAVGWCSANCSLAGIITPSVVGVIFSVPGGRTIVLLICAATFFAAAVLAAFLKETRGKAIECTSRSEEPDDKQGVSMASKAEDPNQEKPNRPLVSS